MDNESGGLSSTPIEELISLSVELTERLKRKFNIHSVEELVAMYTAMSDEPEAMAAALGLELDELKEIIAEAKELIPEEVLKQLEEVPPIEDMPFGALPPEENKADN